MIRKGQWKRLKWTFKSKLTKTDNFDYKKFFFVRKITKFVCCAPLRWNPEKRKPSLLLTQNVHLTCLWPKQGKHCQAQTPPKKPWPLTFWPIRTNSALYRSLKCIFMFAWNDSFFDLHKAFSLMVFGKVETILYNSRRTTCGGEGLSFLSDGEKHLKLHSVKMFTQKLTGVVCLEYHVWHQSGKYA